MIRCCGCRISSGSHFIRRAIPFRWQLFRSAGPLREIRRTFDPQGIDPALDQMVILGKSTGGQAIRMLVQPSGETLWNAVFTRPINEINATPELLTELAAIFFFETGAFCTPGYLLDHGPSRRQSGGKSSSSARHQSDSSQKPAPTRRGRCWKPRTAERCSNRSSSTMRPAASTEWKPEILCSWLSSPDDCACGRLSLDHRQHPPQPTPEKMSDGLVSYLSAAPGRRRLRTDRHPTTAAKPTPQSSLKCEESCTLT